MYLCGFCRDPLPDGVWQTWYRLRSDNQILPLFTYLELPYPGLMYEWYTLCPRCDRIHVVINSMRDMGFIHALPPPLGTRPRLWNEAMIRPHRREADRPLGPPPRSRQLSWGPDSRGSTVTTRSSDDRDLPYVHRIEQTTNISPRGSPRTGNIRMVFGTSEGLEFERRFSVERQNSP